MSDHRQRRTRGRSAIFTIAGVIMGIGELLFCTAILVFGVYRIGFHVGALQTLAFVVIVFGNQATTYTNRERRHLWSSRPSIWLLIGIRRRSPHRLDFSSRRLCDDALAGMGRSRHSCCCRCLRYPSRFCEGASFPTSEDHLGRGPSVKGITMGDDAA